eukprot:g451.t1
MTSVWSPRIKCVAYNSRNSTFIRRSLVRHKPALVVRAEPEPTKDPRTFDEGAAQVRRLMDRDRTQFSGPDFEDLIEKQFSEERTDEKPVQSEKAPPEKSNELPTSKPLSPFGGRTAKTSAVSPFGNATKISTDDPESFSFDKDYKLDMEEDEPWWNFINNITVTQIALACSFLLIITTMLGTFVFVLKSGGIHFNE